MYSFVVKPDNELEELKLIAALLKQEKGCVTFYNYLITEINNFMIRSHGQYLTFSYNSLDEVFNKFKDMFRDKLISFYKEQREIIIEFVFKQTQMRVQEHMLSYLGMLIKNRANPLDYPANTQFRTFQFPDMRMEFKVLKDQNYLIPSVWSQISLILLRVNYSFDYPNMLIQTDHLTRVRNNANDL